MTAVYVDTSCLVAVAFDEPEGRKMRLRLRRADSLYSSNLLEAEFRAALVREHVSGGADLLSWLTWIYPERALTREYDSILSHGYVRGADLWHLACALYLAGQPEHLAFASLDARQCEVAAAVGFQTF